MQHAFKAALDTPLQSAIYTIQQLLHEQGALPHPACASFLGRKTPGEIRFHFFEAAN